MSDTHVKRRSRRHVFLLALIVPLLFVGAVGWLTSARFHQEQLNRELIGAIWELDVQEVHRLLQVGADANAVDRGADVNVCDSNGSTVLMKGTLWADIELVRLLLKHGADVQAVNKQGRSPLLDACSSGKSETIRLLLDQGTDAKARDQDGMTALIALVRANGRLDAMQLLIERGVDVNAKYDGHAALFYAQANNRSDLIPFLKQAGAKE